MFRRLLPFALLGLILFQLLGFTVYFSIEKAKIRKQLKTYLKEGVPEDQFKVFLFGESELTKLNWIKKNEFKIGERYFDVVRKKQSESGLFRLFCVDDVQETQLFKQLAQYVDFNLSNKEPGDPVKIWFSYLNEPMICHNYPEAAISKFVFSPKHCFSFQHDTETINLEIPSPPPNQIITI